ncbi:MAG TPA: hypothetical protein VFW87_05400 [Pirellulales bacterium]|nr:hypothetical protein [Pirellulales bacterium]
MSWFGFGLAYSMEPAFLLILATVPLSVGASLCSITVLIRIFVKGETGVGCACFIPLAGPLILFFYGWSKAEEWEQQRLMLAWSICILLDILYTVIFLILMVISALGAPR